MARRCLLLSLNVRKELLGTEHSDYATTIHNLGELARAHGQFGEAASADRWLALSPWAGASRAAAGAMPPLAAMLALMAWPVYAFARRAR